MSLDVFERSAPGPDGPVRVRVYRPDAASALAGSCLVWAHGGGFAAGSIDMPEGDGVSRSLARRGATVVSIDYRLVDDRVHYPAPSDDVLAAVSWVTEEAPALGIRPDRVFLGGASAGANLAAGVALRLNTAARPTLSGLFLAYPTVHAVQPATPPELSALLQQLDDPAQFGPAAVRGMYERYLGHAVSSADVFSVPGTAAASDLAGLPPVLMVNDETDELRVSGEAFAASLAAAGVEVEVHTEPGTTHGHLNRPEDGQQAEHTIDLVAAWMERIAASA